MRLGYHPLVQSDVSRILRYYDNISPSLGDEFWAELMRLVKLVSTKPKRFHFSDRELRRANMRRFPFHLLFVSGRTAFASSWFDTTDGTQIMVPAEAEANYLLPKSRRGTACPLFETTP